MTFHLHLGVRSEAVFDEARKNRFVLRRTWSDLPKVAWCLTNPSTADENLDDPTLRKVQMYARRWGYGGVIVVNAFSWRATNPKELYRREEDVATVERNFEEINEAATQADLFVCGWGRYGMVDGKHKYLQEILAWREIHALRLIQCGQPEHILYLPSALKPFVWAPAMEAVNA